MAPPATRGIVPFWGRATQFGFPSFSPSQELVYTTLATKPLPASPPAGAPPDVDVTVRNFVDSMAVIRMNFATHVLDTVARLETDQGESRTFRGAKIVMSANVPLHSLLR